MLKIFAVLTALTLPLCAGPLPLDQPGTVPNAPTGYAAALTLAPPAGRTMGASSAVAIDSKGHVWVVDRCGANDCAGSKLDPVMEFDAGKLLHSWGAGRFLFPHGLFIDRRDHIWITDGHVNKSMGDTVMEFTPDGKLLRTLGKPGVPGAGHDTLHEPNAVLVAPDGSIFVADGHDFGAGHNARVIKFDAGGKFIKQWGEHGSGPGQFEMPHCLAMDSVGRLYVGDRGNNRMQIFTQDGKYLGQLTQFGRPSGCFIDKYDVLYVSDSESRNAPGYGHHPGWKRGIRIGSLKDGKVTGFIPDTDPNPDAGTTSGGEGVAAADGAIWSAQVEQKRVVKYVK
jgi:sugar lactone lactonase YvrE